MPSSYGCSSLVMSDSEHHAERCVWIFARPLTVGGALLSPFLASTSDGNYPLCHWGVLVTESSSTFYDVNLEAQHSIEREPLTALWELIPFNNGANQVRFQQFSEANAPEGLKKFSIAYMGRTRLTNQRISYEGIRYTIYLTDGLALQITNQRPD